MVDIHCHILPAIDDGADSWEMTAAMCRVAAQDGITHIVATPHCNLDYDYDRNRFTEMLGQLSELADGKLTFSLGCDFHLTADNIRDALLHPQRYTIGESQYLLVEFGDFGGPAQMRRSLFEIRSGGMVPIITHPERNPVVQRQPELVQEFVAAGCLVQVTANAFTGFWGKQRQKLAEWLLEERAVHVIASDAHDPERRSPVLSAARKLVQERSGGAVADALFVRNPAAIVAAQEVPCR